MDLQEEYVNTFKRDLRFLEYHYSQFSKKLDDSVTRFVRDFSFKDQNHKMILQGMYITGNLRNVVSTYTIKEAHKLNGGVITAKFGSSKKGSTANL